MYASYLSSRASLCVCFHHIFSIAANDALLILPSLCLHRCVLYCAVLYHTTIITPTPHPALTIATTTASTGSASKGSSDDYERAEKAIFHGMEMVEEKIQKAVEEEVHSLYDEAAAEHHRDEIVAKTKAAIQKGAHKVKEEHNEKRKSKTLLHDTNHDDHDDHRILHAVEAAEKAVLHAVQEEVDQLFHELHSHDNNNAKGKGNKHHAAKQGVQKAKQHVEQSHQERQKWMSEKDAKAIDEYIKTANSMYGLNF